MHDGTSTGTDARCATPATAKPIAATGENRTRLSPTEARIVLMLKCMDPCPAIDIRRAGGIASQNSLKVLVSRLRRKGYDIACYRGCEGLRETTYSLRGEP